RGRVQGEGRQRGRRHGGHGPTSGRGGDEVAQRGQLARPEAKHRAQPLRPLESPAPLSFLDDTPREPWAHTRQARELLRRRLVEVERAWVSGLQIWLPRPLRRG